MIIKKVIESVFVCFLFVWREERTNETKKNWEEITLASPLSGHHEMTIDDHPIWLLCPSPNAGNRRRISLIKHLFAWILGRITQYTLARRGEKGDSRRDYHRTDPDISSSFLLPFSFLCRWWLITPENDALKTRQNYGPQRYRNDGIISRWHLRTVLTGFWTTKPFANAPSRHISATFLHIFKRFTHFRSRRKQNSISTHRNFTRNGRRANHRGLLLLNILLFAQGNLGAGKRGSRDREGHGVRLFIRKKWVDVLRFGFCALVTKRSSSTLLV